MSESDVINHPVQAYFEYYADSKTSICKVCKKSYKNRHSGNLLNHLKRKHHVLYSVILPKCIKYTKPKEVKKATINVTFNVEDLRKAFVAWVTVDARPYSLFSDVGAKSVLDPIFDACDKAGLNLRVNNQNVKDLCMEYQQRIEHEIIEQTRDKFISVIMDIVDIQNRSYLGISIRYEYCGKPVTRFIAVKRLLANHTGSLAAKLLKEALDKLHISMDDIISITTDNGANLLRAIKIWQLFQSHLLDDFLDIDLPFTAQQEAYDLFIDKELKKHSNTIKNDESEKYCLGVRCAAHTLNLVFDTALKASPSDESAIEFGRDLIKKLRTGNIENLIQLRELPKPQID
ncbi:uncharacterized protein LOC129572272, partial [Sitodiplosis mosellana]|uniref:uncharacterized protein LOC129572272 n=1 Tax=Sitodiplosis mosellana TaxID=263140 RepID=UPI002444CFB9